MRTKTEGLTAIALQTALWEAIQGIKSGKIEPREANSIASQAREICRVTKLQLDFARLSGNTKNTPALLADK